MQSRTIPMINKAMPIICFMGLLAAWDMPKGFSGETAGSTVLQNANSGSNRCKLQLVSEPRIG